MDDVERFADWLAGTKASLLIQDVLWIVPTIQTVHILAIAMVMSSVGLITLRILGLAGLRSTLAETVDRYVPWIWGSLGVLAVTGAAMVTGEPRRALLNSTFQIKMLLVVCAILVTVAFQLTVRRTPRWAEAPGGALQVKAVAVGAFLLWCAIAVAGRWIGYSADNQ